MSKAKSSKSSKRPAPPKVRAKYPRGFVFPDPPPPPLLCEGCGCAPGPCDGFGDVADQPFNVPEDLFDGLKFKPGVLNETALSPDTARRTLKALYLAAALEEDPKASAILGALALCVRGLAALDFPRMLEILDSVSASNEAMEPLRRAILRDGSITPADRLRASVNAAKIQKARERDRDHAVSADRHTDRHIAERVPRDPKAPPVVTKDPRGTPEVRHARKPAKTTARASTAPATEA